MPRRSGSHCATAGITGITAFAYLLFAAGGCVSNEYRISRDELQRLAQAPLEARGNGVRVVQELGSRRGDELAPPSQQELTQSWEPVYVESDLPDGSDLPDVSDLPDHGGVNLNLSLDARGDRPRTVHPRGIPHPRGGGGHVATAPTGHGTVAGGAQSHGGGGLGLGNIGGGGGGGGNGDAALLVIVAVVAVVAAAGVAIGLIASEGNRFQGKVAMAPQQPLHIEDGNGTTSDVVLADLQPVDLVHATGAVVKDDEGYGLLLGERDRLDRVGGAFNFELGATSFNLGRIRSAGPAAEIQVGGFLSPRWGLMVDLGVSGGDVAIGGAATAAASVADTTSIVTRHHLALELQSYPVSLAALHVGLFGRAGGALVGSPAGIQGGPLAGGGVLLQYELTSRLALILRGGVDTAHLNGGWSTAATVTAGVSIY